MLVIDSQSVTGTELGGEHGVAAHKKINGRKRHILFDNLGLIVSVVVTSAAVGDGEGAKKVMAQIRSAAYPRFQKFLADQSYHKYQFPDWVKRHGYYVLEIGQKPAPDPLTGKKIFKPVKWRWVVERTPAWLGRYRRHSQDYERTTESSTSMIYASSIQLMLQRLKPRIGGYPFRYPKPQVKAEAI